MESGGLYVQEDLKRMMPGSSASSLVTVTSNSSTLSLSKPNVGYSTWCEHFDPLDVFQDLQTVSVIESISLILIKEHYIW